jgi:hypothetical protein
VRATRLDEDLGLGSRQSPSWLSVDLDLTPKVLLQHTARSSKNIMPEKAESKKAQAAREALDIIEEISVILVCLTHSPSPDSHS